MNQKSIYSGQINSHKHKRGLNILTDNQIEPYLLPQHLKTDKNQNEDRTLYQEGKECQTQEQNQYQSSKAVKYRIEIAMLLLDQNQELEKKIELASKQLEEQKLKTRIFTSQIAEKNEQLEGLTRKHQQLLQFHREQEKMTNLSESVIPMTSLTYKSSEMSTTYNTSAWINEFLDKNDHFDTLWDKEEKEKKNSYRPVLKVSENVKRCTIDLTPCLTSYRESRHKTGQNELSKLKEEPLNVKEQLKSKLAAREAKQKKTIVSVAHNNITPRRELSKQNLNTHRKMTYGHGDIYEKKVQAQKPICYLRNKKGKNNPQSKD